jgi:hypothetical protein
MANYCHNCGNLFEGRPNRAYCSQSCKSATNNRRYAERDFNARKVELKVRANRNTLFKLHQIFGDKPLPPMIIDESNLDTRFNSGASADAMMFCFLDFAVKKLSNQNYQILKTA